MRKTSMRLYVDVITASDDLSLRQTNGIALQDLLGQRLRRLLLDCDVGKGGHSRRLDR